MFKYKIDKLDSVEEAQRGFYKEHKDGGFTLRVEGVVATGELTAINQKLVDATEEAVRRRKANDKWKGLGESPEAVKALLDAKGKPDADHQAIITELKATHTTERAADKSKFDTLVKKNATNELRTELTKSGVLPEGLDLLANLGGSRISIADGGEIRILSADLTKPQAGSGADGYANMADLAKELAAATPQLVKADGTGGGGKPPASGDSKTTPKTITRSAYDAMSPAEQRTVSMESGVTFTDK